MRNLALLAAVAGTAALVSTTVFAAVIPPRLPRPSKQTAIQQSCGDEMGFLRNVSKFEIGEIGDDRTVMVEAVCADDHLTGNATGLRNAIQANDTLASALEDADATAQDVIGIRFGGEGAVLLYVMR